MSGMTSLREERALQVGEQQPEDRRPEEDPGEHLAHHARLAEVRDRRAHEAREEHDHDDGEEEGGHQLGEVALLGRGHLLGRRGGAAGRHVERQVAVDRLPGDRAHALVAARDAPGDRAVAVDQAPDPALDLIGAGAGLLELERASEAVRARRELVLARDRRRRARTQRAGRGRVALELGAQRRAAERPGQDALDGDRRHERALAAADARHVALQAPVAQPRLREHRPVGPAQPDELARLRDVHLQPGAALRRAAPRRSRRRSRAASSRRCRPRRPRRRRRPSPPPGSRSRRSASVRTRSRADCIRASGGREGELFR